MSLEKQVKRTACLQLSPVERTIEGVEGSKLRIQKTGDNRLINIEDYKKQVEEKLPKIIDNIDMLGFEIIGLSEYGAEMNRQNLRILFGDYSYKLEKGLGLCQIEGGKIHSGMFMFVNPNKNCDYNFYVIFDKDSKSIVQIDLYNSGGQGLIVSPKREFIQEYINSIEMFLNQKSWEKGPIRLPFILAEVPDLITKTYRELQVKKERESKGTNALIKQIGSLKISNIL